MVDIYKTPWYGRKPKPKKEEESEMGPGKADIVMCPEGNEVYYYKSWHHNMQNYRELDTEKRVKFELCPVHQMKKDDTFEGLVTIENIPSREQEEIVNLVENVEDRAYKRDPMDRILSMQESEGRLEIKTSENQLAVSIGKQVQRAHKNSEMKIKFSDSESVARIKVWWPDE